MLRKKHGSIADDVSFGVCGAGDGLVIQITEPVTSDLNGKPSRNYMNRKGFFALLIQAFCGAYTRFWYFNVGWPGATNDIIAYKQIEFKIPFLTGFRFYLMKHTALAEVDILHRTLSISSVERLVLEATTDLIT